MLESCWTYDEYHTAIKAANNPRIKDDNNTTVFSEIIEMLTAINELWIDLNPNCHESAHYRKERKKKNRPSAKVIKEVIDRICNESSSNKCTESILDDTKEKDL